MKQLIVTVPYLSKIRVALFVFIDVLRVL